MSFGEELRLLQIAQGRGHMNYINFINTLNVLLDIYSYLHKVFMKSTFCSSWASKAAFGEK